MINIGNVRTKRITVKTYKESYTTPLGYSYMLIQNHGLNRVRISFKGDDSSDYFGLDSHDKLPVINIIGGVTTVNFISEVSNTDIEILLWG